MNLPGISSVSGLTASQLQPKVTELTPQQRARATHLRGAALRHASPSEQRAAVASQFEAILVRQLLGKTVSSMVGSGNDAATSVYGDLLTDTFAQQLTAGSGMGLSRLLEKQLAPRGAETNPPAASAT